MIKMSSMRVSESMRGAPKWPTAGIYDCDTAGLAQHAREQIENDYIKRSPCGYPGICKLPTVTVTAIGTHIYIASSVKASNYIMNFGQEKVREALLQTEMKISCTTHHRTHANCGERAATH